VKRKALGKGLGALIVGRPLALEDKIQHIPIGQIKPAAHQPRKTFSTQALDEMAKSITQMGIILPVVVRPVTSGYELISGERRWRSAKIAGLEHVPVIVRNVNDSHALEMTLVENLQREDLNPIEAAFGYNLLHEEHHLTQEEIAQKVGKDRTTIANTLRLLKLPVEIQTFIKELKLTVGHAKVLLSLKSKQQIIHYAKICIRKNWSVRKLEAKIQQLNNKQQTTVTKTFSDPVMEASLDNLRRHFATKICLKPKKAGGGSIILEYYSSEDFNRIFELLIGD